jgi:hypothetical protein
MSAEDITQSSDPAFLLRSIESLKRELKAKDSENRRLAADYEKNACQMFTSEHHLAKIVEAMPEQLLSSHRHLAVAVSDGKKFLAEQYGDGDASELEQSELLAGAA